MGDLKFQLQHYAAEMWRRKWSILLVGLLVGLLGTYIAASRPDVFTSRAAVQVDENALLNAVLPKGAPRTNTAAAIDSVRRGIYARPSLEQIIYATDLHLTLEDQRGWEGLVTNLEEKLELKRQGPNFYVIEYTHNNPVTARNVTQAALDLFLEKAQGGLAVGQTGDKDQARKFLQDKLDTATANLKDVQAKIAVYQRENGDAISGSTALQNQLRNLQTQLSSLKNDRLLYAGELSNLQSRLATTPPTVQQGFRPQVQQQRTMEPMPVRPTVSLPQGPSRESLRADSFEQQVNALGGELQTLLETKTPQHPDVITMQNRYNAVQGELAGLRAAANAADAQLQGQAAQARSVMAQYEQAMSDWRFRQSQPLPQLPPEPIYVPNPALPDLRAQAADRRSRVNVIENQMSSVNTELARLQAVMAKQPEIVQAYSKLETAENKYLSEVSRLEEDLSLIAPSNIQAVNMTVIEPPIVPVTPAGPNRLLLFMGAFMLASGSGMGLAFMRVQFADNIPTIKHLKQSFDLPILGGVSMMESKADTARNAAGNLVFLASVAALIAIFGYVTYRYHFELWRPDFAGLLAKFGG